MDENSQIHRRFQTLFENEQIRQFLHRHGLTTDGGTPLRKEDIEKRLQQIDDQSSIDLIAQSLIEKALDIKRPLKKSNRRHLTLQNKKLSLKPSITIYDNSCAITMIYSGPKHFSNDKLYSFKIPSDEVIVMQYQTNSSSIIVYKSYLRSNDEFTFKSHRLLDTPFTIAIYINGVVDSRLSTCCEQGFLQQRHSQLKRSVFQLLSISGGTPCYTCQTNQMLNSSIFNEEDTDTQLQLISTVNAKQRTPLNDFQAMSILSETSSTKKRSTTFDLTSKFMQKHLSTTDSSIKQNQNDQADIKIGYEEERKSISSLGNPEMQQLLSKYLFLLVPPLRSPSKASQHTSQTSLSNFNISQDNIDDFVLIWLNQSANTASILRTIIQSLFVFHTIDETNNFLKTLQQDKIFLIISDSFEVNQIDCSRIHSIYFLNQDKSSFQQSHKVRGNFSHLNALCECLREDLKQISNTFVPLSISNNESKSAYLCTQLHRELLLTIEYPQSTTCNLISHCKEIYKDNPIELEFIDTFQNEYHPSKAIWWYTLPHFLRETLNNALLRRDTAMLQNLQFFIKDLHNQLEQIYEINQISYQCRVFTVYRAIRMSSKQFHEIIQTNVNHLLVFDTFLSTNLDREETLRSIKTRTNSDDLVVLFQIEINTEKCKNVFADISCQSAVSCQNEILFSLGSIFCIDRIVHDQISIVYLSSIDDNDERLQNQIYLTLSSFLQRIHQTQITRHDQQQIVSSYANMANILSKQEQYENALELYEKAFAVAGQLPSINPLTIAAYEYRVALIYMSVGQLDDALFIYERVLKIRMKHSQMTDITVIQTLHAIGDIYREKKEFSKALKTYQKALQIQTTNEEEINRSFLAVTHIHIALNYHEQNQINKALTHFLQAIDYQKEYFSQYHPILAFSYNYISILYHQLDQYESALKYQFLVLGIEEHTLPNDHSNLANTYSNIAIIYEQCHKYDQAIIYAKKSVQQLESHFDHTHSDVQLKQTYLEKLLLLSKD